MHEAKYKSRIILNDNVWAELVSETDEVERLLRYHPDNYWRSPSYISEQWDGYRYLTHTKAGKVFIPIGLVPYVMKQPFGRKYELVDERVMPERVNGLYSDEQIIDLDPHQLRAVEDAWGTDAVPGIGVIQYPTGTGKGRIIGEIIRRLGLRALVLCDKVALLSQLGTEIGGATGIKVGRVGGGKEIWADVTVSTFQTLAKRLAGPVRAKKAFQQQLAGFDVVIVDEGHHSEAKTLTNVLKNVPAYFRFGFSATVFKGNYGKPDKPYYDTFLNVQAFLGPLLTRMSIIEGVETGRIVPADVIVIEGCDPDHPDIWTPDPINWKEEYERNVVKNYDRNYLIVRLVDHYARRGLPTLVLVAREEHGRRLQELYCELYWPGEPPPFIYGKTPLKDRQYWYDTFKQHGNPPLIIGKLGDEGLDLPNAMVGILAGGGKANHVQLQRIGRFLRAAPDKERALVYDFMDYGRHNRKHSRKRLRLYQNEEAYTVSVLSAGEVLKNIE